MYLSTVTIISTGRSQGVEMEMSVQFERGVAEHGNVWPVAILNWPEDAAENDALAHGRRPRLLLLAAGTEAPPDLDGLSDWVRRPATAHEIYARAEMLQRRSERTFDLFLDTDGLLRRGRRWVALSPVETRLMESFLSRPGSVISRGELLAAGWPVGPVRPNALHPRLSQLRGRIADLGALIVNVRQRGYALSVDENWGITGA